MSNLELCTLSDRAVTAVLSDPTAAAVQLSGRTIKALLDASVTLQNCSNILSVCGPHTRSIANIPVAETELFVRMFARTTDLGSDSVRRLVYKFTFSLLTL